MKNYPPELDEELLAELRRRDALVAGEGVTPLADRVEMSADDFQWLLKLASQKLDRELRDEGFYRCEDCEKWVDDEGIVSLEDVDICKACWSSYSEELRREAAVHLDGEGTP